MEIITIESSAYKELVGKIDKIAEFVTNSGTCTPSSETMDITLDNKQVLSLLRISRRTLQRLRSENLISYSLIKGKCLYKYSDVEKLVEEKLVSCDPQTLDDLRNNYMAHVK